VEDETEDVVVVVVLDEVKVNAAYAPPTIIMITITTIAMLVTRLIALRILVAVRMPCQVHFTVYKIWCRSKFSASARKIQLTSESLEFLNPTTDSLFD